MRYMLDANVTDKATKPAPPESLVVWMSQPLDEDLFVASMTVAEMRQGVVEKPLGKRQDRGRTTEGRERAKAQV